MSRIRRWRHGKAKPARQAGRRGPATPQLTTECQAGGAHHNIVFNGSSQLPSTINPSLLLLDSSAAPPTLWNDAGLLPFVRPNSPERRKGRQISEQSSYELPSANEIEVKIGSERNLEDRRLSISQNVAESSLPIHLRELGNRLRNIHSRSYVSRINSILRYSSTDSWRSSWSSFMSHVSSRKSKLSIDREFPNLDGKCYENSDIRPESQKSTYLSGAEKIVWEELVDISKLALSSPRPATFDPVSPTERPCCRRRNIEGFHDLHRAEETILYRICGLCGLANEHYFGTRGLLGIGDVSIRNINITDRFGNTPLHFLAASGKANLKIILNWIRLGADIQARNTGGDTFMHVLNIESFPDNAVLEHYETLATHLLECGFDLCQQNYFGRTISQAFLESLERLLERGLPPKLASRRLDGIISRMGIRLLNCSSSSQWLLENPVIRLRRTIYIVLTNDLHSQVYHNAISNDGSTSFVVFTTMLQENGSILDQKTSILRLVKEVKQVSTAVDRNGDTLLFAILKVWSNKGNEILLTEVVEGILEHGAEINIRDREGDTILTIACCRGFRPVVKALLDRGANIHSRNKYGQGILYQSKACIQKAESEQNDKTYAGILSCMNLIMDAGCKWAPTEMDEWTVPDHRTYISV